MNCLNVKGKALKHLEEFIGKYISKLGIENNLFLHFMTYLYEKRQNLAEIPQLQHQRISLQNM